MCAAALLIGGIMFVAPAYSSALTARAATDTSDYVSAYRSDAENAADALSRANELNQRIVEEGIVLMKNAKNALPLSAGNKITPSMAAAVRLPARTAAVWAA